MQLALLILTVVVAASGVGWIGKAALTSWAFAIYAPVFIKPVQARQTVVQREVRESKSEIRTTSRQGQFTEWARLREKVDKGLLDLESINATLASRRARFDQVLSVVFYAVTSGLQWGIVWWYRRQPVMWIPAGWMPASVTSLLSVGGAPKGAVSVTVWSVICNRAFHLFAESFMQWVSDPLRMLVSTWSLKKQPEMVPELD